MKTCEIVIVYYGVDPVGTTRVITCRTHDVTLYSGPPVSVPDGSTEAWVRRCEHLRRPPITEQDLRKAATAVYLACEPAVADDLNRLLRAAADAMRERDDLRAKLGTPC